jgi:hypothetical protein
LYNKYFFWHQISNLVYIGIFFTVDLAFTLIASSFFAAADGNSNAALALQKAGGAFAFIAGLLGYYLLGNLMLQEATFFSFPMGDTSRFFKKKSEVVRKGQWSVLWLKIAGVETDSLNFLMHFIALVIKHGTWPIM